MKKIGREVLFIECKDNNPRNGEGSFIRLKNGAIMFGYTEYIGDDYTDHANARISCITSYDEGETWQDKTVLIATPADSKNVMSLSFLRMNNDDIAAFYIHKNIDGTSHICVIRSNDEGKTWSEPINCMDTLDIPDYFVLNNDRVLKLQNGRIIFSVAKHSIYKEGVTYAPGEIYFFVSDDDGYTWAKTNTKLTCPFTHDKQGFQEPGLYQFEDGKLWCYIRTHFGCQIESFSYDNGETWSAPMRSDFFTSPHSPMLVKDAGQYTLAIFNPIPMSVLSSIKKRRSGVHPERSPYVCAVSYDKGKTFDKDNIFFLEDDLTNSYCYPAIIEGKDYFLLAYYHSNDTPVSLHCQKIIKVNYEEVCREHNIS